MLAPLDHTAALRYSWLPTAAAAADPARAAALDRLAAALTGPAADGPLAQAGLRRPGGGPPPGVEGLPAAKAPLFDVLGPHHVDHVLASWYAADRRSDLLVAVDVSGSMLARAPGSDRAVIEVVRDGIGELASLLPDESQLTLWRFGTRLDGTRDHEAVLRGTTLDGEGRVAVSRAVGQLVPHDTGTGLHDTILAAYEAARDAARPDVPSHVVVFTDGRNEADQPTLSLEELGQRLAAAKAHAEERGSGPSSSRSSRSAGSPRPGRSRTRSSRWTGTWTRCAPRTRSRRRSSTPPRAASTSERGRAGLPGLSCWRR